jgi:hypothetical protein
MMNVNILIINSRLTRLGFGSFRRKIKLWLIPLLYQLCLRRVEHESDFFNRQGFLHEAELYAIVTCRSIIRQREMHQRDAEQESERNADLQAPHDCVQ